MKSSASKASEPQSAPSAAEKVRGYLDLATRENTRRSYSAAVRHFEIEWGGLLPATTEAVARYLADQAERLSPNTLQLRLAALARWHQDQGFADPTKSAVVRKLMRGIRAASSVEERRAKPLMLSQVQSIDRWIDQQLAQAQVANDDLTERRLLRDRCLLLLGFWRGFRGDELARLRIEHLQIQPGAGMECFLSYSKTDADNRGRRFSVPALSQLCPVQATQGWLAILGKTQGAVFRKIDQWGHISSHGIRPQAVVSILRTLFQRAGINMPEAYSGHSLRRGFATFAADSGWDVSSLMQYVGWRDVKAAARYIEASPVAAQHRIEGALANLSDASLPERRGRAQPKLGNALADASGDVVATILVRLKLTAFNPRNHRSVPRAQQSIESLCFERYEMRRNDKQGTQYELTVRGVYATKLEETMDELIDEMHRTADTHRCVLEASVTQPETGRHWD